MPEPIVRLEQIEKVYENGVVANRGVDFDLVPGEVHAIVGENGSGKTTLMKILFGLEQPTAGKIYLRGQPTVIDSPKKAISLGIGMVHQHFMLVDSFTALENLMLGEEPKNGTGINWSAARKRAEELMDKYKMRIPLDTPVGQLSVGIKQKIEILKALLRDAHILILDEPTAVLTPQETEELFVQMDFIKQQGHTLIFISHKLREVMQVADRVSVLKKGEFLGTWLTAEVNEEFLSRQMVGRDVQESYERKESKLSEPIMETRALSTPAIQGSNSLSDISIRLRPGIITGVVGIEGNGQSTLVKLLTGQMHRYEGDIILKDKKLVAETIGALRTEGLAYVPEDRMIEGISVRSTLQEGLTGGMYDKADYQKGGLMDLKKLGKFSEDLISHYQIVAKNKDQPVGSLSGGNIQKAVVAREFSGSPEVLILEEPTRGIDVGAAEMVHKETIRMRDAGCAVLLISSDLAEVMKLSDILYVITEGKFVGRFTRGEIDTMDEQTLGRYMLGLETREVSAL